VVIYTVACLNAIIMGIGLLMEANKQTYLKGFYKTAGITTMVQSALLISFNMNLIIPGLILCSFTTVIIIYILHCEMRGLNKDFWKGKLSPA
jgi:hypothetical protein